MRGFPPVGAEKQAVDVSATVVMEREAVPTVTDQNAMAPMYRQKATKASGSHQSNQVVGWCAKTANRVVLAPFTLPVMGISHHLEHVTSKWHFLLYFPGTVNTPSILDFVQQLPSFWFHWHCGQP